MVKKMAFNVDEIEKNIESMNSKIKKADELIIQLEQVSKHIEESKVFLDAANQKFEQLTITDQQIKNEMLVLSENLSMKLVMSLKANYDEFMAQLNTIVVEINNAMSNIEKDNKKTRGGLKVLSYLIVPLIMFSIIQIIIMFGN